MTVLRDLAEAAVVLMLLELMVILLVILAMTGGLAFGTRWLNKNAGTAFSKANTWMDTGQKYIHRGTEYLALPIILTGRSESVARGTVEGVKGQVRRNRARREGLEMANEAAKPEPPDQEPNVLV